MKKHGWVFTLNNYSAEEIPMTPVAGIRGSDPLETKVIRQSGILNPEWVHDDILFVGYGKEIAGTGTPHLQGMLVFNKPVGLRTLKRLNGRAHFQPMRGSFEEAKLYASKENFTEWLCHSVESYETLRLKVEEDHLRAKVIADEETTIVTLTEKIDKLTDLVTKLAENQIIFEKKIQTNFLHTNKFV